MYLMMSFKTEPMIAFMYGKLPRIYSTCYLDSRYTSVVIPTTTHSNIYGLPYQKFAVHTYIYFVLMII